MTNAPEERRHPARPLAGYQDTGDVETRYGRRVVMRSWMILTVIALLYLGWTLVVYFLEPGLR